MSDAETENQPESTTEPDAPDVGHIITGFLILALIGILVAIVVPTNVHGKSREMRAYSTIKNCDLALTKVLRDAQVSWLRDLFFDPTALDGATDFETVARHTDAIYALLRDGKNASLDLRPEVRNRLGSTYIDLTTDPWKNQYVFYMPHGNRDETTALDRKFHETYMTMVALSEDEPLKPWQKDVFIYIVCKGKDGQMELLESNLPSGVLGDDFSNLRDPSAPGKIESLGKPAPSR